ncbi:TonB-dependent receptor [Paraglaciecola aquimarina]|uniref:TonB-dependent receptor n=1 Tax=Paraglaciecola algarum TaxID=3050085 RepID=A0ABS9D745_9ALTE|nr:TonB-dependent receptor [Paraglaciecola sp. G1-23]MCF2948734.1 TonB-dependent receptor [Paraglaciecola sp. G1-23]
MTKLNKISQAFIANSKSSVLAKSICATALLSLIALPAVSQETPETPIAGDDTEVIQVKGIRGTIQDSIAIKKLSTSIVDGITADDIGELPALSIGEALETLTGASSHREQGGATEISIRGLGPFLGSTVFNGREAANGSGDRSVNFSQFPSELFNKIEIYKTQEASLIEGGVSGQISLGTLKPLDYGKRRFQVQAKGNWNPAESDIDNSARDFGTRFTASYVDQFETENFGEIGFSIGGQLRKNTNPEQEARTTSGWRDCRVDPSSISGVYDDGGDCDNGGIDNLVDPVTGVSPDAGVPYVFVPSSYSYRQNISDDSRDSIFGAVQWRPNESFEMNFDAEFAERLFSEKRNDLVFASSRRLDDPTVNREGQLPVDLVITDQGSLVSGTYRQRIETLSTYLERLEEYKGGGVSFEYNVNDLLTITGDLSVSETERREGLYHTRLQSEPNDILGNPVPGAADGGYINTAVEIGQNGSLIPIMTVRNFDVSNPNNFADAARTRVDQNQFRNNKITAFRTDFEYLTDSDVISRVKGGVRFSKLEFDSNPRTRDEFTNDDDSIMYDAIARCQDSSFPESGFLSSVTGGQNLITNLDSDGNVIAQGTGNAYASFDPLCLATAVIGGEPVIPEPRAGVSNVDVEEKTTAAYIQADYDTEVGDYGLRGNFGVRYVNTDVTSRSFRGPLITVLNSEGAISNIVEDPTAELFEVSGGSSYTELLPSLNVVLDIDDEFLVRGAVYRALSRPAPSDMGFGRTFSGLSDDSEDPATIEAAIGTATANGNPNIQPFTSWNADVAVEWYPNDDTLLAVGAYYKSFAGGFENTSTTETFIVDGQELDTIVTVQQTTKDKTSIYGVEMTATHAFNYLPSFWKNFGVKLSYNWADSDFEVEDANFGASSIIDSGTGESIERIGLVAPAEIFGFSDTVISGQFYYQEGDFNAQLIYKYRSEYFQQYISTPGNLRYVDETGVVEARVSYKLNKNLKLSVEAINLFDEPKKQFIPTRENFGEINVYGPRIYAGFVYKL